MAKRLPPRNARGQFVSRKKAAKRNPSRRSKSSRSRSRKTPSRDSYGRFVSRGRSRSRSRRNPGRTVRSSSNPPSVRGIMDGVVSASIEAGQLTVGKAASRALPNLVGLPQAGNIGLLTRAGAAVALGVVGGLVGMDELGETMMAGGLQGVLEDAVVGYNLPFLADALRRPPGLSAGNGTTGRYVPGAPSLRVVQGGGGMARYVPPAAGGMPARGLAAMSARGWY